MRDLVVDLKRALRRTLTTTTPQLAKRFPWGFAGAAVLLFIGAGVLWRLWQRDYFWQNPFPGARVERLTDFEGDERDAAISPDGKFATFVSNRDGPYDAWVTQIGSNEFVNVSKGQFASKVLRPLRKWISGVFHCPLTEERGRRSESRITMRLWRTRCGWTLGL